MKKTMGFTVIWMLVNAHSAGVSLAVGSLAWLNLLSVFVLMISLATLIEVAIRREEQEQLREIEAERVFRERWQYR